MCKQCIIAGVVIAVVVVVLILAFNSQPKTGQSGKAEGADCRAHSECASGVCDFYKQDMGKCTALACQTGDEVVGISGAVEYSCNNSRWVAVDGEQTCKDNPYCDLDNPCGAGLTRALRPDQYGANCQESMAQMILPTVCIDCGDGVCDINESECNCPADCGDDPAKTSCILATDCGINYNVWNGGRCDAGCFNVAAQVDPQCRMMWELIAGTCTCVNNKCVLKAVECGDGICSISEDCPADCSAPCTDSDGGNDTATWGMATGIDPVTGSQVTTGDYCALADEAGNIQMVDSCSNSNPNCKLFEMNCEPGSSNMAPSAVECPTGCDDGICV